MKKGGGKGNVSEIVIRKCCGTFFANNVLYNHKIDIFQFFSHISFVPFEKFLFPGDAQQVQLLHLLIDTAAREGAQQFIEMIFSTSAGILVFDAYKDSQPLPEVVARDHGHNKTACYLEGVTKRYIICSFRVRNLVIFLYSQRPR